MMIIPAVVMLKAIINHIHHGTVCAILAIHSTKLIRYIMTMKIIARRIQWPIDLELLLLRISAAFNCPTIVNAMAYAIVLAMAM